MINIQAGSGNATAPLTTFSPQQVEIKRGDTVRWYNPTQVGEPHTVTFVLDNKTMTGFAMPFGVASSTQFMSIPPNSNSEPVSIPGKDGMKTIVAINSRVYNPVVIDSANNVKTLRPNATYVLNGNEKYSQLRLYTSKRTRQGLSWIFKHIYCYIPKFWNIQVPVYHPSLDDGRDCCTVITNKWSFTFLYFCTSGCKFYYGSTIKINA